MAKEYTANRRCPVCGGHGGQVRGKGIRCNGYIRDDGHALCARRLDSGIQDDRAAGGPFGVWDVSGTEPKPPTFGSSTRSSLTETPRTAAVKPSKVTDPVVPFYGEIRPDMFPEKIGDRKRVRIDSARQADGGIVAVQVRYVDDQTPDDKLPIPYTPRVGGKWKRGLEGTNPIFGIDDLVSRPTDPVLVVEGPKAREGARRIAELAGYVIVSPFNGCQALVPVIDALRGRNTGIYWWPDADDDGKGQEAFAKAAEQTEAKHVYLVNLPDGLTGGWDLGDDLPDGLDPKALLAGAVAVHPAAIKPEADTDRPVSGRRWVRGSDLDADDGRIDWLIDGVIEAGSTALLYGPSGHGKTFVTLDLALSVATGSSWASKMTQQGQVVYVAAEGTKGIGRRFKAWRRHRGEMVADDAFVVSLGAVRILEAGDVERFIAELCDASIRPSLIVLDTLAQCLIGGDENNGEAIGRAIDHANHIRRETGAAVLFVHHTGKDVTKGARGHSSLFAAMDTVIAVSKVDAEARLTETLIKVTCDKQKDAEAFDQTYFKLQSVDIGPDQSSLVPVESRDSAIAAVSAKPGRLNDKHEIIRRHIETLTIIKGGATWMDIKKETDFGQSTIQFALDKLQRLGFILFDSERKLYHIGRNHDHATVQTTVQMDPAIERVSGQYSNQYSDQYSDCVQQLVQ